jgi:hypothetical protein
LARCLRLLKPLPAKPNLHEPTEEIHVAILAIQVARVDPKERELEPVTQAVLSLVPLTLPIIVVRGTVELDCEERVMLLIADDEIKVALQREAEKVVVDTALLDGEHVRQANLGKHMRTVRLAGLTKAKMCCFLVQVQYALRHRVSCEA